MHSRVPRLGASGIFLLLATISLQADINLPTAAPPPQADAVAARVLRGEQVAISLRGHHGGGGAVTFLITEQPAQGKLSDLKLRGDDRASVFYRNDGRRSLTNDHFAYAVRSTDGRVSSRAEVTIFIDEPPAHLRIPEKISFDEIEAGQTETEQLIVGNDGGSILECRLTASAPWQVSPAECRIAAGKSETIAVVFRPNESGPFVGQVTLTAAEGAINTVALEGNARLPIRIEPAQIWIGLPRAAGAPRTAVVALTNISKRKLKLNFEASRNIQPIPEVFLAPAERKEIQVALSAIQRGAVHESLFLNGEGFSTQIAVEGDAAPVKQPATSLPTPPPPLAAVATPIPTTPIARSPMVVRQEPVLAIPPPPVPTGPLVAIQTRRLPDNRWELRWARPEDPLTRYQIEERFLAFDSVGQLQTNWQPLAPPEIVPRGDSVTTQISGLGDKGLHLLRVTAFSPEGATLWQSPVTALEPAARPSHRGRSWIAIFGCALAGLFFLRWKANRALA